MKKNYLVTTHVEDLNFGYDDCEPWLQRYYDAEELFEVGIHSVTCISGVKLELLILNGFLPADYYESDNDDDYLDEDESDLMFKESGMTLEVI